jgi:hypothetical protein
MFTNKLNYYLIAVYIFIALSFTAFGQPNSDYSEIIIKLRSEADVGKLGDLASSKSLFVKPLFRKSAKNEHSNIKIWNIYSLKSNSPDDGQILQTVLEKEFVLWAHYRQFHELFYTPNDPSLGSQYYLGLIRAFDAWDVSMGGGTVKVGIVDTGIDPSHVELIDQIAYNLNDPVNGIDDDGDGFIDNYMGWNMAENNYNVTADINPHGVGVAGIVAAKANNGIGMAGVAPNVKILPVKIMNNRGLLSSSYEGVVYAAEQGCKIIVCSWGGVLPDQLGREVTQYVTNELGALVVAAAGNSRNENLYYPASYPGVVSVLASNSFNHKWEGSTYGHRIDIAAPGQNIFSTAFGNTYSTTSGTSNAAPIVAGVASVISFLRPHLSPAQLLAQMKATAMWMDTLPANVPFQDKLGAGRVDMFRALSDTNTFYKATAMWMDTLPANVPFQDKLGAGRVDMFRALSDTNTFYIDIPTTIIEATEVMPGETHRQKGLMKNLLKTKNAVTVTISPLSEFVSLSNGTFTVNNWPAGGTVNLWDYNVRLSFSNVTPMDLAVPVRFSISTGGKTFTLIRTIRVQKSWYDLARFDIKMTLSNIGKPAYHKLSPLTGEGFRKGFSNPLLWEAGLIVGISSEKIVSAVAGYNDFTSPTAVIPVNSTTTEQATAFFTDMQSTSSLGLNYQVKAITGNQYPLSSAMVYEVTITNTKTTAIENIRMGMFANWIVRTDGLITTNQSLRLVSTGSVGIYPYTHGVAVLSSTGSFTNYSFDTGTVPQGININDNFSRQEMWQALSSSREMTEALDKSSPAHLVSAGPYSLQPGQSATVRFAFLTDTHVQQLENHVQNLRDYYASVATMEENEVVLYPNPASKEVFIPTPTRQIVVYDVLGSLVFKAEPYASYIDVSSWKTGVYFFQMEIGQGKITRSVVISK